MLPARFLVRQVEVLRATTTTDRYGNEVPGPEAVAGTYAGWFAPQGAAEDVRGREQERLDGRVFLNPDADVEAGDSVRIDGSRVYEVIGPPEVFWAPEGPHHIELEATYLRG